MTYIGKTVVNEYGMVGTIREVNRFNLAHVVFDSYYPGGGFCIMVIPVNDLVAMDDPHANDVTPLAV